MKEPDYYRYFGETERRIIKVMNVEDVIDDLIAYYEQAGTSDKVYMWINQAYWKIFISHEKFNKAIRKRRMLMTLNEKIKELRKEEGLTIAQVAKATGYAKSAISRMETGSRTISWKYLTYWIDKGRIDLDDIRNSTNIRNC